MLEFNLTEEYARAIADSLGIAIGAHKERAKAYRRDGHEAYAKVHFLKAAKCSEVLETTFKQYNDRF